MMSNLRLISNCDLQMRLHRGCLILRGSTKQREDREKRMVPDKSEVVVREYLVVIVSLLVNKSLYRRTNLE